MSEYLQPSPVELTKSQKVVSKAVMDSLKASEGGKKIIIVEGFGGIGKTTLVNQIQQSNSELNIQLVSEEDFFTPGETLTGHSMVLITRKPARGEDHLEKKIKESSQKYDYGLQTMVLKGMTQEEMENFLNSEYRDTKGILSKKTILKYSLGIPTLARILCRPGLTEEMAISITESYLRDNMGRETSVEKYLSYPVIPVEVIDKANQLGIFNDKKEIYDDLGYALIRQLKLAKQGIRHEDPVFIAPESKAMYDAMIQEANGRARIDIFVPTLSDIDYEQLVEKVGIEAIYENRYKSQKSRANMFLMEWRKVSVWQQNKWGEVEVENNEYDDIKKAGNNFVNTYQQGNFGVKPSFEMTNRFLIHSHAHQGEENPTKIGFMVETLLQQRGISYFVYNGILDKSYWFDHEHGHIKMLDKPVEIT